MKRVTYACVILSGLVLVVASSALAEKRGVKIEGKDAAQYVAEQTGKSWAVVIGIDDYEHVRPLRYAVADAKAVAQILRQRGFDVTELYDKRADRRHILGELGDRLVDRVGENDRVLIFYSGHGETKQPRGGREMGFLLPVGAEADKLAETAIPMSVIRDLADALPSKHVLFLVDVCYGGIAGTQFKSVLKYDETYLREITRERGRQLITAGGPKQEALEGPEWGHSVFTYYLLEGLTKGLADLDGDGIIPASELHTYLNRRVFDAAQSKGHRQKPEMWKLANEPGEFVFFTAGTGKLRALPTTPQISGVSTDEMAAMKKRLAEMESKLAEQAKAAQPPKPIEEARARPYEAPRQPIEGGPAGHEKACEQGDSRGCVTLGFMYAAGRGISKDEARSVSLFQRGCDQGNARACIWLGRMHAQGRGVPKDSMRGVSILRQSCEGGNASGCVGLGYMYLMGLGVVKDKERGVTLYQQACDQGERRGCINLGFAYEVGDGVKKDENRAATLFRQGCEGGDDYGCMQLGRMYQAGRGVAKDANRAISLFQQSCNRGEGAGCGILASAYERGDGVAKDIGQAVTFYQKSCDLGSGNGCTSLGYLSETGTGLSKDLLQAVILYQQGCDGFNNRGCSNLGILYDNGRGVSTDKERAAMLYQRACEDGYSRGCASLGWLYENGTGVPKDEVQAVTLYQQACDGRDAYGCANLGSAYDNGKGVAMDQERAVALFQRACEGGNPRGCSGLGNSYSGGRGIARDRSRAIEFLDKGCKMGDSWGCDRLKQVQ